jgi:hypothetical protein
MAELNSKIPDGPLAEKVELLQRTRKAGKPG